MKFVRDKDGYLKVFVAVGEVINVDNKKFVCRENEGMVPSTSCDYCYFQTCDEDCVVLACQDFDRSDKTGVHFEEVKK